MADPIELEHSLTIDGKAYDLIWLESHEALDEMALLECEITDGAGGPDPGALVNKKIELVLSQKSGSQARHFVGYVIESENTTTDGTGERGTRVTARPRFFRLTQRRDCRVFQDVSAQDIVKKVLADIGLADADQQWKLTGTYSKRVYTTQYRESDWDFIHRLMSEEGIAFAFDMSSGTDVVVFFDGDLDDIEGDKKLPYGVGDGLSSLKEGISSLSHELVTAPGKVALRDYDFTRPQFKLDSKAEGENAAESALEVYEYPGRFTDPTVGDRYAKVMLDSLRARRELVRGTTNTLRLEPGRTFELENHPYDPINQEYMVLEVDVVLEARRASPKRLAREALDLDETERDSRRERAPARGTHLTFQCIPTAKTTYRPPRVPRAPHVPGAQVAMTTGAPGEEIHPDEHGRVKVQFFWDRLGKKDDTSSLWIRTCQIPLGGIMLTPRVNWEVYLNFIEGDPDQPFVFGRMYNAKTPPPYSLPKEKTKMSIQTSTTPGGGSVNELRMDDKAGSEEMHTNASKDASVSAGNNATESIGNNETRSIGANHNLAVTDSMVATIGANQTTTVGGTQSVHVGTFMVDDVGSHSLAVGGSRDLKAGGDHKRTVTGASTLSVGGMQIDLVAGSVDEQGLATMEDHVSAVLVDMTASNRTVTVKGSRTETAGAAKAILTSGGRAVSVGGSLKQNVVGAILTKISGNRSDSSSADYLEIAGGAQLVKATNVVFQAESLLSIVMGASTITLTPASVSIAGTKITLDGECDEESILVTDN